MDQDTIEAINQAKKIEQTMGTEGWQIMRQMLEDQITNLQSIEKIQTLRELQAKQSALKALRGFLQDVDAICHAKLDFEKGTIVQKLKDPILKVLR